MISGKCRLCLIANSPLPVWAQCAAMALRSLNMRAVPVYGECVGQEQSNAWSATCSAGFSQRSARCLRGLRCRCCTSSAPPVAGVLAISLNPITVSTRPMRCTQNQTQYASLHRSTAVTLRDALRLGTITEGPPTGTKLDFHVHRSRLGNLPVYTDFRTGGSRKVTIVRKFAGNAATLGKELERLCASPVTLFHGRVEVKGIHDKTIREWLLSLGF